MKKQTTRVLLSFAVLIVSLIVFHTKASAAVVGTTVAGGVDYSAVYNYQDYIKNYPDVAGKFNGDDVATLNYFIEYGMSAGQQASTSFDVHSYYDEYPDLRQVYGSNMEAYYLHYMNYGQKEGRTATGVAQLVGTTVAGGVDYSAVYNYRDYIKNYPDVAKKFNGDDVATLNYFIEYGMSAGQQASTSFDVHSYYNEYPDLRQVYGSNMEAYYLHYMNYGKNEGRTATGVPQRVGNITSAGGVDYSAVYDYQYYIKKYPDVAKKFNGDDVATLNYFIEYGMSAGQQASASFDVHSYYNECPDLRRAYGNNMKDYYLHYIYYGQKEGRTATGINQLVGTTVANGVDYSPVYNYDYYIKNNTDVATAYKDDDVATLNHFIVYGMSEGRNASETFDVHSYYLEYPDLRQIYGSNLKAYYLHYINYGKYEGRTATGVAQLVGTTEADGVDYSPVYDYQYYILNNLDVASAYHGDDIATLNHFVVYGMTEGRRASETFDVNSYYLEYPDLRQVYGRNMKAYYIHYINYGQKERRTATGVTKLVPTTVSGGVDYSAVYNYDYYKNNSPDVATAYNGDDIAILNHFIQYGMYEGRQAADDFNVWYYRANYPDLQSAYGNSMEAYYLHYVRYGKGEGRNGKNLWPNFTGWFTIRKTTYYFDQGTYCTGWQTIGGVKYLFSDSGVLLSRGIDVSDHQGSINWQQVKDSGVSFAMIRIGFGDDETDQDDPTAAYNISECERLGIAYGVYLYSYATDNGHASSEADHILRLLGGRHPALGVYYDVEDPCQRNSQAEDYCEIVMDRLQRAGYGGQTGIYTYYHFLCDYLKSSLFTNNKLWMAQWSDSPSQTCYMWQYSDSGSVPGISGNVDLDILFQ